MNWLVSTFQQHPYSTTVVATWVFNNIITVLVSSLPAPTKDSTVSYQYWFKVANTIIGNINRAHATAIEKSPNWQDAVDKAVDNHVAITGGK